MSTESHHQELAQLFERHFASPPQDIINIPKSGSDRQYYRLVSADGQTAIGTYNAHVAENNTFFYFTEMFKKHGIHIPEIYVVSKDRKMYLQQDLGSQSLFDKVITEGHTEDVLKLYKTSIEQLVSVQWEAGREIDFHQCYGVSHFDEEAIMTDLMYFKYYFADLLQVPYNKQNLYQEMKEWSRELGRTQPLVMMYRDFQSRNIMIHEGMPYFIDYQGAMHGPAQYDIASLLYQAKAKLPQAWKEELLNHYVHHLQKMNVRFDEIYFRRLLSQFILLRIVQTLGAYGFRGLIERKVHFLSSIGPALEQLKSLLNDFPLLPAYTELRSLLERLCSKEIIEKYSPKVVTADVKLKVEIQSFSYKNGYPKSNSEHGGGYVFDCRGILNPGRIDLYKTQTGLDEQVIHYLESQTQMPEFIKHIEEVVSITVEDYIDRNFDYLSINFGCTGGQHRSVYSAETVAKFLKNKYGITAKITHTNKENWKK